MHSPAARLKRAQKRGAKRGAKYPSKSGRYKTQTGLVSLSRGRFRGFGGAPQMMANSRKEDYRGAALGTGTGAPTYAAIRKHLPRASARAVYDPRYPATGLTQAQRRATSLTTSLLNVSEAAPGRASGYDKYARAVARQAVAKRNAPGVLDESVQPAVAAQGGAKRARDLMSGKTKLSKWQRSAVANYMSDSSDDDEPPGFKRRKLLTPYHG